MHEFNSDYYRVVIEDRRRMATEFFHKQHMARSLPQEQPAPRPERTAAFAALRAGVTFRAIRRLLRPASIPTTSATSE